MWKTKYYAPLGVAIYFANLMILAFTGAVTQGTILIPTAWMWIIPPVASTLTLVAVLLAKEETGLLPGVPIPTALTITPHAVGVPPAPTS